MKDRLVQLFTLCHVPRWAIIDTTRPQTVGEHTFRVMAICERICSDLNIPVEPVLVDAFTHDMDEAKSGDIPTPYKKDKREKSSPTWQIVKLADYAEAIIFLRRYGVKAKRVEAEIYAKMMVICNNHSNPDMIREVMNQILFEGEHYE